MRRRTHPFTLLAFIGFLGFLNTAIASDVTVGREGVTEFIWAGEPLRTIDQDEESPFHCEIISFEKKGDATVYTMVYTLLEPGEFNLNVALLNLHGRPVHGLPDVMVSTETLLPKAHQGALLDYTLTPIPSLSGFSAKMFGLAIAWTLAIGVSLYMIWPRKEAVVAEVTICGPTVADLLKPFIQKAASNSLSTEEKVSLNTIFFRFWQVTLGLKESAPVDCMARLREHEQAGELLACLDRWLFSAEDVDADELKNVLGPYSGTLAADLHLEDLK